MRPGQRYKVLAITALATAVIWFKFVYGLGYYSTMQRVGVLGIMELLMLLTVWLPTRKRHRRRRSTRSNDTELSKADLAKYEQLS